MIVQEEVVINCKNWVKMFGNEVGAIPFIAIMPR